MSLLLLDTNIVSFVFKMHPLAHSYEPLLGTNPLAISFMTVAELHEGAARAKWGERKRRRLTAMLQTYLLIDSTHRICQRWGQIRAGRYKQPIAVDDAFIAATAVEHNLPLVTHNPRDFDGISGLQLITAQAP